MLKKCTRIHMTTFFPIIALLLFSLFHPAISADNDTDTTDESDEEDESKYLWSLGLPNFNAFGFNTISEELDPTRVKFLIYSNHKNLSENQELFINNNETFRKSVFKLNKPTKILVHGFLASCDEQIFPVEVLKAYLKRTKHQNILCVDWTSFANPRMDIPLIKPLYYRDAVYHTLSVGEKLAKFIAHLSQNNYVKGLSEVHVVGLSLGAHIAGIAGYHLKEDHNMTLGRITGLDPAGLLFRESKPLKQKLDASDAEFVDVVHTNMGRLGITDTIAHVDFFPNGGRIQPSCYQEVDFIASLREQISGQCSHMIAASYFKESLRGSIRACKATSWEDYLIVNKQDGPCEASVRFGEPCPKTTRGKYYFKI